MYIYNILDENVASVYIDIIKTISYSKQSTNGLFTCLPGLIKLIKIKTEKYYSKNQYNNHNDTYMVVQLR